MTKGWMRTEAEVRTVHEPFDSDDVMLVISYLTALELLVLAEKIIHAGISGSPEYLARMLREMGREKKESDRVCPGCGYLITAMHARRSRFDYTCPRCRKYTLSEFVIAQTETMQPDK